MLVHNKTRYSLRSALSPSVSAPEYRRPTATGFRRRGSIPLLEVTNRWQAGPPLRRKKSWNTGAAISGEGRKLNSLSPQRIGQKR